MYCRLCGEQLFELTEGEEVSIDQVDGLTYYCPECEWVFMYEEGHHGELKEISEYSAN